MTQVKLSSKYQIVIPEDVREQLGLVPGQLFDFFVRDDVMIVVRVKEIDELYGSLSGLDTSVDRDDEEREALRHGATLWTHDAHFRGLPGVLLVEATPA